MSFNKQICQIQMLAHLNKTYMRASLRCMSIKMFGTYEYEEELSFSEVAALIEYMEMRAKTNNMCY